MTKGMSYTTLSYIVKIPSTQKALLFCPSLPLFLTCMRSLGLCLCRVLLSSKITMNTIVLPIIQRPS